MSGRAAGGEIIVSQRSTNGAPYSTEGRVWPIIRAVLAWFLQAEQNIDRAIGALQASRGTDSVSRKHEPPTILPVFPPLFLYPPTLSLFSPGDGGIGEVFRSTKNRTHTEYVHMYRIFPLGSLATLFRRDLTSNQRTDEALCQFVSLRRVIALKLCRASPLSLVVTTAADTPVPMASTSKSPCNLVYTMWYLTPWGRIRRHQSM